MVSSFPKMQKSSASFSQSIKHGDESLSQRIRVTEKRSVSTGRFVMCRLQKNFSKTFRNFATNADKIVLIG